MYRSLAWGWLKYTNNARLFFLIEEKELVTKGAAGYAKHHQRTMYDACITNNARLSSTELYVYIFHFLPTWQTVRSHIRPLLHSYQ